MRVAALVSGGKDSALALHRALRMGYEVKFLVTMFPRREDSWMFHFPNLHLTELFAKAAEIPLVKAETSGMKEKELKDLKDSLATLDIEGVVSGAISSKYQKERIDKVCRELNLESITPLWQEDSLRLLEEIISLNFEVVIVGVYAYGFDQSWLGKRIDSTVLKALGELHKKHQVSLVGEGGEYETLVLDAPFFKKRIILICVEKIWENHRGCMLAKKAELTDKT